MTVLKKGIQNIRAIVNNTHWVQQIIDEHLNSQQREVRVGLEFHPSSCGKCQRLIQLSMLGVLNEKIDARLHRIFDAGNDMHNRYKRYFEDAGVLIADEKPFRLQIDDITIKGRVDLIVKDFMGEPQLLELKTMNSRRFEQLMQNDMYVEENFIQWNIYSRALDITKGVILYENKDDQRIKPFSVQFCQEEFDKILNKLKFIHDYNMRGEIVPKPAVCNSRFCNAKEFCKESTSKELNTHDIFKNLRSKI
jgi:hypothetical protein